MSYEGTLRDRLDNIARMMPLSEREKTLAGWVIVGDGQMSVFTDMKDDPEWWGPKAIEAVRHVLPEEMS